ncbi:tetratricopeptide repeat protein 23 [Cololabis saira]|uniref:tetratricopeptide repeat protein 23 n=1 Tax=Cololabis saira TaxID=129043 RepID=UPI002AD53F69|nr:tetratricopeptide repeat protein 23 [Cololabis saira]
MNMWKSQDILKTRMDSSKSSTALPESMGSAGRGLDVFTDRGSHAPTPSQGGWASKDFLMMSPEEKLKYSETQAQTREDNQEFDSCIQDLVRIIALTKLVHGERHLKVAQGHARLAKGYFQFKGWGQQAQEHSAVAREILSLCSSLSSSGDEKLKLRTCLLNILLTQGGASLLTENLEEAESSFLEAEQVLEELHRNSFVNKEEKIKAQLEITSGLYRVYKTQNRPEEALNQCGKSLQLLKDCNEPEKTGRVYRDMAAVEQDRGHLERAVEHLSKAHAIAVSHSPGGLEDAQISHSLALILSTPTEAHHNDSAGHYFELSLSAYSKSVGSQDPTFLAVQDDFCRFLLINGQQKKCVEIQRASLDAKRSAFGDLSAEVADTLQLIGSVEMTEGRMDQAHRTMTKCLKIQSLLNGPQHKKTKTVRKAVDMLARTPEVVERHERHQRRSRR